MPYRPQWAMPYRDLVLYGEAWVQPIVGASIGSAGSIAANTAVRDTPIEFDRTPEYFYVCGIAVHVANNPLAIGIILRDGFGNPLMDDFCGVAQHSFPAGKVDRGGGYAAVFEPPVFALRGAVWMLDVFNFDNIEATVPNMELRGYAMRKRCA